MSKTSFYQEDFLNEMRQTTDPVADQVVSALFKIGFNPMTEKSFADFIYNYQAIPTAFPQPLRNYFEQIEHPDAYPSNQIIKSGSRLFQQYGPYIMSMLGALSLPYCYASGNGVQVLYMSERMRDNPSKRLLETAAFVLDVCHPDAFKPEGKAFRAIAKVRLMHAAIRYHALKSGRWQEKWGLPINQEDMAGTNLAFSLLPVRGLRKLGHSVTTDEAHQYIQMWNIIGKMLGIKDELLPESNKAAFFLEKHIRNRSFCPTFEGKHLTRSLIEHLKRETNEKLPVEALIQYLLGNEVAEIVGLEKPKKSPGVISFIKIMNRFKSFKINEYAYHESIASYRKQKIKLGKEGIALQPYRMVNTLKD